MQTDFHTTLSFRNVCTGWSGYRDRSSYRIFTLIFIAIIVSLSMIVSRAEIEWFDPAGLTGSDLQVLHLANKVMSALMLAPIMLVMQILLIMVSAQRIRHLGWSGLWAVLLAVPAISTVCMIFLCFAQPRAASTPYTRTPARKANLLTFVPGIRLFVSKK